MRPASRKSWALLLLALLLGGAVALRLFVGPARGAMPAPAWAQTLELREARAVMGLIVGAALAVAGVMLQSLLRNPLASPDLLGLASGAGLGVMAVAFVAYEAGLGIAGRRPRASARAGFPGRPAPPPWWGRWGRWPSCSC